VESHWFSGSPDLIKHTKYLLNLEVVFFLNSAEFLVLTGVPLVNVPRLVLAMYQAMFMHVLRAWLLLRIVALPFPIAIAYRRVAFPVTVGDYRRAQLQGSNATG
jgi:hypothetical protein